MNLTFLDFETTFQIDEKKNKNPSPYLAKNYLVSYGLAQNNNDVLYKCVQHNTQETDTDHYTLLQETLDNTDILVAFNAKFELAWLRACGFTYNGQIRDPMLMAYVLSRGQKWQLSLDALCNRYNTKHRKLGNLVDEYLKKGIGFEEIPWVTVQEYGINDILSMRDLYHILLAEIDKAPHLWPTIDLTHEFCQCLTEVEEAGVKINITELDAIENNFKLEVQELKKEINRIVSEVMGDTKINLESPEQLSWLIYSRQVKDKKKWKETFNLGSELRGSVSKKKRLRVYSPTQFVKIVKEQTEPLFRTIAEHCEVCHGSGVYQRTKADGTVSTRFNKCPNCCGIGFTFKSTGRIAGLRQLPSPSKIAVGGFSTDKGTLETLADKAEPGSQAKNFLTAIVRVNQLEFYLSTFIDRIKEGLGDDGIFHPKFYQHTTATGRLSSDFQNMPRADKFPLRKCIISRWSGGSILGVDAKQLEFRVAGELSGSKMIFEDVLGGLDVHAATAKETGFSRQDSKPYTFRPVYGGAANGQPENIAKYIRYFDDRYKLPEWHSQMCTEIIKNGGLYRTPSGREFDYGEVKRHPNGGFSRRTQIANYPVQSFATADIVPVVCIRAWRLFKEHNLKSRIVLEAHDDTPVDVYPGEEEIAIVLMKQAWKELPAELIRRYNYTLKMPIEVDIKIGPNWLDMKEVK